MNIFDIAKAIARVNGHPEPETYASKVKEVFEAVEAVGAAVMPESVPVVAAVEAVATVVAEVADSVQPVVTVPAEQAPAPVETPAGTPVPEQSN